MTRFIKLDKFRDFRCTCGFPASGSGAACGGRRLAREAGNFIKLRKIRFFSALVEIGRQPALPDPG